MYSGSLLPRVDCLFAMMLRSCNHLSLLLCVVLSIAVRTRHWRMVSLPMMPFVLAEEEAGAEEDIFVPCYPLGGASSCPDRTVRNDCVSVDLPNVTIDMCCPKNVTTAFFETTDSNGNSAQATLSCTKQVVENGKGNSDFVPCYPVGLDTVCIEGSFRNDCESSDLPDVVIDMCCPDDVTTVFFETIGVDGVKDNILLLCHLEEPGESGGGQGGGASVASGDNGEGSGEEEGSPEEGGGETEAETTASDGGASSSSSSPENDSSSAAGEGVAPAPPTPMPTHRTWAPHPERHPKEPTMAPTISAPIAPAIAGNTGNPPTIYSDTIVAVDRPSYVVVRGTESSAAAGTSSSSDSIAGRVVVLFGTAVAAAIAAY